MIKPNLDPDEEDDLPIGEVVKDKSLTYMGLILGGIILVMGYLTLFVDDPWKIFRADKTELSTSTNHSVLLNETSSMSDDEVRQSLIKFIEAFYYDQSRGYFDPPSYFAPITETFYNYHNLTYQRLKDLYWKRRRDMENLKRNWIVSSLEFTRQGTRIAATYWATESYFRPSKREQQSADIKYELITNETGKIVSIRELEIKNFESYQIAPSFDTIDTGIIPSKANPYQTPAARPGNVQTAPAQSATAAPIAEEVKVYDASEVEFTPEYIGGQKELMRYLSINSRFPLRARQNANQGKVELSFIVEKNGELKDVKLLTGSGGPHAEEAVRLMKLSPPWKPGQIAGKPIRSIYQMHITFKD